jgi:hypothetical protein
MDGMQTMGEWRNGGFRNGGTWLREKEKKKRKKKGQQEKIKEKYRTRHG